MEYWRGMMNWPIEPDASCETCGNQFAGIAGGYMIGVALTWGFVNGECRCDVCHTVYTMRDGETILTQPLSRIKDDYKAAAKAGWQLFEGPIDEWTEAQWDHALDSRMYPSREAL